MQKGSRGDAASSRSIGENGGIGYLLKSKYAYSRQCPAPTYRYRTEIAMQTMQQKPTNRQLSGRCVGALSATLLIVGAFGILSFTPPKECQFSALTLPPHPRYWIEILEGTPFVVPQGKILVVAGLGLQQSRGNSGARAILLVDDFPEATVVNLEHGISMQAIPPGLKVGADQLVSVVGTGQTEPSVGQVWGYLINAGQQQRPLVIPGPEEWIAITDQQAFTVPAGKIFVALSGGSVSGESITVRVNGTAVLDTSPPGSLEPVRNPRELPIGIRARPGEVISVEDSINHSNPARLYGFLVNA